jgi:NADH-quinone oxidoreductase subunit H
MIETPTARLAFEDFGPATPPRPVFARWLAGTVAGWAAFVAFLIFISWLLLAIGALLARFGPVGAAVGNIVGLILILVMVTATLLTMADRKWSALMQDRVGPNRARLSIIPGLRHRPLKGIPHILADVLKMLFKEDFIPEGAMKNKVLFNLAPLLAFAPAFMLFAIVPVSPEVTFLGQRIQLQVARVDWGILYVFALASLAVFATALAGWTSDNKLALLGGLRASAQLISYEVTLGLTLVGAFIAFGSLRLEEMAKVQGELTSWGLVYQPIGMILFLVAAQAEIKRAPFDTPEGESEIIGYFLEYSGLKSGLFLIAEYAETVVVAGIVTTIFLGGYHLPYLEPTFVRHLGFAWLAVFQVFAFIVKMLLVVWVLFVVRWAFPRFRYDQVMRLGWKMMLPISLANVALTAGIFLAAGREGLAWMGGIEWLAIIAFVALSARAPQAAEVPHAAR